MTTDEFAPAEIETRDLDAMNAFLSEAIVGCRVTYRGTRPPRARLASYQLGRIALARVSYNARIEVDAECPADTYVAEAWLAGSGAASVGRTQGYDARPGTIVLRRPESPIHTELAAHASVLVMRIPPALGDEFAAPALGQAQPATALDWRIDPTALRFLSWLVDEAARRGPIAASADLAPDLERLVTGLICRAGTDPDSRRRTPLPRYLHLALAAANQDPMRTCTQLADAAGVSLRTLQGGFRSWLGAPPSTWLRERRLDCAFDRLSDADPSTTTVTQIALNCGFDHLGRFAGAYRERHGESPSVTLRRPR